MATFWKKLTPEQREQFIAKRKKKILEGLAEKKKKDMAIKAVTTSLSDIEAFARSIENLKNNPEYCPPERIFAMFSLMVESKGTIETAKMHFAPKCHAKVWDRFKKLYLMYLGTGKEDLIEHTLKQKRRAESIIQDQLTYMQEKQKEYPKLFAKEIIGAAKAMMDVNTDFVKTLDNLSSIGVKDKGIQINIINKIPRPNNSVTSNKSINAKWEKVRDNKVEEQLEIINGHQD